MAGTNKLWNEMSEQRERAQEILIRLKEIEGINEEKIDLLNEFQENGTFHPYTCMSAGDEDVCQRRLGENEGLLTATEDGWICPCGQYTQEIK